MSGSFLQSRLWSAFKGAFGWKPYAFSFEGLSLNVLLRPIAKIFSLAYIPYAPIPGDKLEELSRTVKRRLPKTCIFIRYDLPWYTQTEGEWKDAPKRFKKASLDIQPPSSVILDISRPLEEIQKGFKERVRRNIKTAEKKGVTVTCHGAEKLPLWYDLYKETAERDRISIHPYIYYQKQFDLAKEQKRIDVRLYLASDESDVIAGIITFFDGNEATYLYGASANRKRDTMPAYALQWKAIQDAKEAGCLEYDFFGIPPVDDPAHPMHGLYLFKTGWGGTIIHRGGAWDYPCHPLMYQLYCLAEKVRKYYYKTFKKKH